MRALFFCSFLFTGCSALLDKLLPEEEKESKTDSENSKREEGDSQGDCYDGIDNDDDGHIDCEDQGCDDKSACSDTGWTNPDTGGETWDSGDTVDTVDTQDTDTQDTEDTYNTEPVQGSLQGNTYLIDFSNATFTQPAGIGSLFIELIENDLLMGIISDSNGQLRARGAVTDSGSSNQAMCIVTEEGFSTGSFSANPAFFFPPFEAQIPIQGVTQFSFQEVQLSGVFAPDGSYFENGVISGVMDVRDNYSIFQELGLDMESPSDVCALMAGFGVSCNACSDGQSYCIDIEVVDIYAPKQSGVIVEVTSSDISNNPQCN